MRVADCARTYDLTIASPSPFPLSFNYVAPAVQIADGREVVVKLSVPGNPEVASEAAALRVWNGNGAVRLLRDDVENGVQILERLRPGGMLSVLWDEGRGDEATDIAARVMQGLREAETQNLSAPLPGAPPFLHISDWSREMSETRRPNTPPSLLPLIKRAQSVFSELFTDAKNQKPALLHGDLHHFNILQDGDTWKAIDPKGVWGPPAFEPGAFLRNPWPGLLAVPDPQAVTNRRLAIFADVLAIPREEIRLWAFASTVLSAWWSVEAGTKNGGDGWRHSASVAELLAKAN